MLLCLADWHRFPHTKLIRLLLLLLPLSWLVWFSQEKLLVELKRKREKSTAELKEARAGKREADKRCRLMEEEKKAICDDYEGRLQQQVRAAGC